MSCIVCVSNGLEYSVLFEMLGSVLFEMLGSVLFEMLGLKLS